MTWAADDRQYFGVNDGAGWLGQPLKFYNSRMWFVSGAPSEASSDEVAGYPQLDKMARPEEAPSYCGHGTLAVQGRIYPFLSTLDTTVDQPRYWTDAKLNCSPRTMAIGLKEGREYIVQWRPFLVEQKISIGVFSLFDVLSL